MTNSDLFWQALIFSSLALGVPLLAALWLYVSPLEQKVTSGERLDKKWATRFAAMIAVSTLCLNVGAYWDASQHIITGIVPGGQDFLWPPHIVLYAGFLLALIVALLALTAVAVPNLRVGVRDPRVWVRKNPMLGAVALAAGYAIFSIPGDAIWHQLFGVDLTAWSPPHVFLAFSLFCVGICAAALLAQTNPSDMHDVWRDLVVTMMLALVMSAIFLAGVSEWELGRGGVLANIANRPLWLYPVVTAGLAFAGLAFARHLTRLHWAATITALIFFAIRFTVIGSMSLINGVSPRVPLVFIAGALALDVMATRLTTSPLGLFASALAYTLGFACIAFPQMAWLGLPMSALDYAIAFFGTLVVATLLQLLTEWLGAWFEKQNAPVSEKILQAA